MAQSLSEEVLRRSTHVVRPAVSGGHPTRCGVSGSREAAVMSSNGHHAYVISAPAVRFNPRRTVKNHYSRSSEESPKGTVTDG